MKDKKAFTDNILKNLSTKLNFNSFIMIPTNHPNIEEILKLINSPVSSNIIDKETHESNLSIEQINEKTDNKSNNKKNIITLNDIISEKTNSLNISKDTIITPLAKDYIKQKNIKVNYI